MEILDSQRFFNITPGAGPFTGVMADPPAYRRKGVGFFEQFQRFSVFTLFCQSNVSLNADMGGAGGLTGSRASLCDGVSTRNGLGITFVYSSPRGQGLIVFIFQFYRAYLETFPATRAFGKVYITGMLYDSCREMTFFPPEFAEF